VLTGEKIPEVLEAAHIIPVRYKGSDAINNGFCLRVDLHRLFDSGNLRITADGEVVKTGAVHASADYARLPSRLDIPRFVSRDNLLWRDSYL
jgi:predicted restriction endonuclease